MKSPITGKEMKMATEPRTLQFRKEDFEIQFHFFECTDTRERYTDTRLDELNLLQVHNQYRDRMNIPFPEEIAHTRKKYDVPASKMGTILGFGPNTYRLYEAGEVPSASNAKLIQLAEHPRNFKEMVKECKDLDEKSRTKYLHKADHLIDLQMRSSFTRNVTDYLMGSHKADVYSGYRAPNLKKFTEMVVFFSERLEPFKTKMNKLLFYADFSMFKQSCFSISGMRYVAIDKGPVPNNFNSLFEYMVNKQELDIQYIHFPQGYVGDKFTARKSRSFDPSGFSENELHILRAVADKFQDTGTAQIVELSHTEDAWQLNHEERKEISYLYAFGMGNVK